MEVNAEKFATISNEDELQELLQKNKGKQIRILGGGSNILLTENVSGLLIKNEIKGIRIIEEDEKTALVEVGGGENWHEFVCWTIEKNLGGIENLSLIPGTVGASPIQNIGAYGVELKDVFEELFITELSTGIEYIFPKEECQFGYRDSIFKREWKHKGCITRVYFRLQKDPHEINISYGAIKNVLEEKGIKKPSIKDVSNVVIAIRQSKLPDPKIIGNCGSFFKNPEISAAEFQALQKRVGEVVHYPLPNGKFKIPAGWLIDQCGFKGVRYGNTGCYKNQALVLVNHGNAEGTEVKALAQEIQAAVLEKFGLEIVPEVNIW
ncbi:MAG: UDP-N-acetylmuramate dehydrogenase [Saprospiraceae bacterium]